MFDYTSIDLPLSLIAIMLLSMGWRLLPADRRGQPPPEKRFTLEDYTSEVQLADDSMLTGKTVADLEELAEGEVTVAAIIRDQRHRYVPRPTWVIYAGDILVLEGDPTALQPLIDQAGLRLLPSRDLESLKPRGRDDDLEVAEAVVAPDSLMTGRTLMELHLRQNFEVNVLAVSRAGERDTTLLRQKRFESGDVMVLQGRTSQLLRAMTELGLLPLAERHRSTGRPRRRYLPLTILAVTIAVVAARLANVELTFFVAATLVVLLRLVPARMAYDAVDWPVIVMIGCLIPVGEALHDTGAASVLAKGLTVVATHLSGTFAVGLVMVVTMLVTPFLHHAAAVLVMGPVAATLAKGLGFSPDPFLTAVAFGATCDLLTPIGHQNSTLVMRPGGYRFGDFWRLGLPLSVMVAALGSWLIVWSWPLH
jgi:di/tricarboxylate transporter